jgi:Na+/proline symporter
MFCAKDERHSLLATLWFQVAHYSLRPWPWILTALAAMVLYPDLADPETGYIKVMIDHLPPYLRGLMLAAFAAAYMSTIATQLNWGASYLVNDVYRRFMKPDASEAQLVRVSQLSTVLITLISAVVTFNMDSITGAWKLLIVTGAGTGLVLLLRWYWWRINAWSEVSAMACAFVVSVALQTAFHFDSDQPRDFAWIMILTVGITTAVWLATTLLTAPEPMPVLEAFYRKTHPSLAGWRPVAERVTDVQPDRDGWANIGCWIAGCVLIYGTLFGSGKLGRRYRNNAKTSARSPKSAHLAKARFRPPTGEGSEGFSFAAKASILRREPRGSLRPDSGEYNA